MNKQNKNICIHVCDDNPVVIEKAIKITKDLLNDERLAAEIVAYEDGNQFTERYKERKDELLILDIDMPGKSGLDILKEFEIHCKNNRVILLTAYDNLALQHGMGHLIVEEQVKRLGGMVEYYEDEMFCAHIYLPM